MNIRTEEPRDWDAVYRVVGEAFASAEHSDGDERDLVVRLRGGAAFVPELSLVAEVDGDVVGHILLTKAQVAGHSVLALAPLSVLPQFQRQGIGMALIAEGHARARARGFGYSVVLGSEAYYPRMGYVPAVEFGIKAPFDVPSENFMAYKLSEDAPVISGTIEYAPEFGIEM